MKAQIDHEARVIQITNGKGESIVEVAANGLPADVFMPLIAEGLVSILRRAKDPIKTWEKIQSGRWRQKTYNNAPTTVRSLALLLQKPVPEIWEKWKTLSMDERRRIAAIPQIRQATNQMEGRELPDLSLFR
jgi:hypothetical protein